MSEDDGTPSGVPIFLGGFFFFWNAALWFLLGEMVFGSVFEIIRAGKAKEYCCELFLFLFTIPFWGAGLAVPAWQGPVAMAIAYPPVVAAIIYILHKNRDEPKEPPKLHKAAYDGDLNACRLLLDQGEVDLNAVNKSARLGRELVGATALHSAFFFHNGLDDWRTNVATDEKVARAIAKFEIAQLLIDMGASTRAVDALGKTPIEVAPDAFACARAGLLEPMKMMLRLTDANEMTQTPNRNTLLHAAALCSPGKWSESKVLAPTAVDGKCNCARYLLSHGLSPDSPNDAEMTARQLCTVDTTGPEADELGPGPVYAEMLAVIESWTELSGGALPAVSDAVNLT